MLITLIIKKNKVLNLNCVNIFVFDLKKKEQWNFQDGYNQFLKGM